MPGGKLPNGVRMGGHCYFRAVSSARDRGRAERREGDRDIAFSRRAVLRAGLLGAATLSLDRLEFSGHASAAKAKAKAKGALAPGVYGFNQGWLFGGLYRKGAEKPRYADRHFARVSVPHTVSPLSWGDWNPSAWEHVWVYRKHIRGSTLSAGRSFVDFQGVMTNAAVYLGGTLIAEHEGGYLPWSVELTEYLTASDNVLAVVVDSRQVNVPPNKPSAGAVAVDFLQPGGIYRDVALRVTPEVLIADVFAKPFNVLTPTPSVDVRVRLDASYIPARRVSITATLLDGANQIGAVAATLPIRRTGQTITNLYLNPVVPISLWSPDSPKLYQVLVTVNADGVIHSRVVTIGFRQAAFEPDGFYLNGERLQIFGLNRHQLYPYTGMAAPERLQRRDAELLKNQLGCNMVRCSHYPQSQYFLEACDELGLMVWEEPPGWQYVGDNAYQDGVVQNVRDMVTRDRNHPSVMVWATRVDEASNHPVLDARARRAAKSLDNSRPTSGAMHTWSTAGWDEDLFAFDDYHNENGAATLLPPLPGVPYLVSEAVGVRDGAPLFRWIDNSAILAQQAVMHAQVHNQARSSAGYAGVLGWAGIDYASLNGGVRAWHNLKWAGVLDTFRVPKPGAAFYRSQSDPALGPVILPAFFWDFGPGSPPGGPGQGAMIATNCDSLRLYLDGQLFSVATPDTQEFGFLGHPPVFVNLTVDGSTLPELRIDGYVNGQVVTSLKMSSNPSSDRLALSVEDPSIQGDGTDATRFTFRALDAYGNQRPNPPGDVALSLVGPAQLIAENPFSFQDYGGVGGGLIQSLPSTSGAVSVTAAHGTLGQASATVTVQPAGQAGASGSGGSAPPLMNPLKLPTKPQLRTALSAALSPRGQGARIAKLLRNGGYEFTFRAPFAGKLEIEWQALPAGTSTAHKRHLRSRPLAHAMVVTRKAGAVPVDIKLTGLGRRLLRHSSHQQLLATARFTPSGRRTATFSQVITLRR
jgi:beta-galactosidase